MKISDIIESEIFKNISERFTLILAIPYLIGGLYQFIELSNISLDLIKFFSITQLIVDGIILSGKLIILFIAIYYVASFMNRIKIKSEKAFTVLKILLFLFFVGSSITMAYTIKFGYDIQSVNITVICFLASSALLLSIIVESGKLNVGHFFILFTIWYLGDKVFTTENKIQNINNLTNKLKLEYPNLSLRYYNDQFLFYEKDTKNKNSEIIVRKMDDIFENNKTNEK